MNATQGMRLVRALKRKPHTYMEMLMLGVSVCPWKRLRETLRHMPGVELVKGTNRAGLTTWRVVTATRWTA